MCKFLHLASLTNIDKLLRRYENVVTGNAGKATVPPSLDKGSAGFPLHTAKRAPESDGMRFMKAAVLVLLSSLLTQAQVVRSFEGIDASQVAHPKFDVDPNGSVGTKQYLEWTNVYYQAFDKVTFAPLWPAPQSGILPFQKANMTNCQNVGGDGIVTFDRLASRWVIAARSQPSPNSYYYCVAISNTDDLASSTLSWYTYQFSLSSLLGVNAKGDVYFPDWPRFGTWSNAYFVSFDLNDADRSFAQVGVLVCALDRTNMLIGAAANPMQCFSDPDPIPANGAWYLKHSVIPADIEGKTAPPAGRDEFLVSIQNPPKDGKTAASTSINLWQFHVDWTTPANSALTRSTQSVSRYTPGCYDKKAVDSTLCVPESTTNTTGIHLDSVGDRLMPRFAYRNFGSYESYLVSHTVQPGKTQKTGIRWYEFRITGSTPAVYQSGTISPDTIWFRYMPSIAQDKVGNAAVGYNLSRGIAHPGIKASWWNLEQPAQPKEINIIKGIGDEENSPRYGDYNSMTVDPVDDCTFWFVAEYFQQNQTGKDINWDTRIGEFKVPTCK